MEAYSALLPRPMAQLPGGGLRHGSILTVQDQAQHFGVDVIVVHQVGAGGAGCGTCWCGCWYCCKLMWGGRVGHKVGWRYVERRRVDEATSVVSFMDSASRHVSHRL